MATSDNTIRITSYNCRGAMSNAAYLDELMGSCDILCVQEHHLYYEHKDFLTTLNTNFTGHVKVCDENNPFSSLRLRKGGLAILWNNKISYSITNLNLPVHSDRIMAIRIDSSNSAPIFVINIYLPSTNYTTDQYRECITDWQITLEWLSSEGTVVSCGDFNGQLGSHWGHRARSQGNDRGRLLGEFLIEHNLFSTITNDICGGPAHTCIPGDANLNTSILDHFIIPTDTRHQCLSCYVHEDHALNTSDHLPITFVLKCRYTRNKINIQDMRYNWNKSDPIIYGQNLRSLLSHIDGYTINSKSDIDQYITEIHLAIKKAVQVSISPRRFRAHVRPFWDDELKDLHKEQIRLRHVWIGHGKPRDNTHKSYTDYKAAKRRFAGMFEDKQQQFYQKEYEKVENDINMDIKTLWKRVRPKRKPPSGSAITVDGITYKSQDQLRDMWRSHYQKLLNEQASESARYDSNHANVLYNQLCDIKQLANSVDDPTGTLVEPFVINEIASTCIGLPNNKAPGYDNISYECVKYGGYKLYEHLTYLYNNVIRFTHVPQVLKHSVIIPLYKGKHKPRNLVGSYRGVSLTPTLNKILEKLVLNRLKPWLTQKDFPPPLQQAGREKTNCICLTYMVLEAIRDAVFHGSKVYGCFLDIKSAYDVINWQGLLVKLWNLGIKHKLWNLFEQWLTGSTAHISTNCEASSVFEISRSIKQGGLLSTFYFLVFYHDMHSFVTRGSTQPLTFHNRDISSPTMADDTLLLSTTPRGLQTMIDNAYMYGRLWRLEYSPSKTKCIVFGDRKRKHIDSYQWFLGDQRLEIVTSYNYLGVIISGDGSSQNRTLTMANKGYANLGMLKASGFHSEGLSPLTCSNLWQRLLIPSMLYGCEVWGDLPKREMNVFETVQKRIGKHIQGLHKRTHDEIVRGLLGWTTIAGTIDKCKLKFIYKMCSLPPDNIIKYIFLCQLYSIIFAPQTADMKSYTYNLWSVIIQHDMTGYVLSYLTGGTLENKKLWSQVAGQAVLAHEQRKWKAGLCNKGAHRFLRVHQTLQPSVLYSIIKCRMECRKSLMNMVRLLAYPEKSDTTDICTACHQEYTDTVEHYVMRCEGLVESRSNAWDNILDGLDCDQEVQLLSYTDQDFLDIILSKRNSLFNDVDNDIEFCCISANNLMSLMEVVR